MNIRSIVKPSDLQAIELIVASTGFFYPDEISVAVDLAQERLDYGESSGYAFLFAQDDAGAVMGYTCYGPICCTRGSYDLYWIAVHASAQRTGLGRLLLDATEVAVRNAGGRNLYIETSGRELYRPTQAFYQKCGYIREAVIKDFYDPGDDKLIYTKHIG